ncbi:PREDICTED: melanoma-associated antigen B1-like [Propithecus coquereli]|uniref:melanoma-associated antigen B1-like n=1 Tax=Propithecus coquereli TaxID=379532 RepID=UPI00063EF3E5|nr:PREDICTED: melanoma-associated antigen B1-like [Propithecus coquereli]
MHEKDGELKETACGAMIQNDIITPSPRRLDPLHASRERDGLQPWVKCRKDCDHISITLNSNSEFSGSQDLDVRGAGSDKQKVELQDWSLVKVYLTSESKFMDGTDHTFIEVYQIEKYANHLLSCPHSHLLSPAIAVMPHEKCRKARGGAQGLNDAQATAAEKGESPSPSSPVFGNTPSSSPAAGSSQKPQRAPPTTTAAAGASCTRSDRGAKSRVQENAGSSEASSSSESSQNDPLTRKAGMLMHFLLEKYKKKEPIKKAEMLKAVNNKYEKHFPEILKRASERLELVFGLDLKEEVNPSGQSYTLVSKLDLNDDGSLSGDGEFPKNELLMPLLAVIFLNGNSATEEDIWEFLNVLGVYDGSRHLIFGEPRKLITQDLVQEKYLVYQQVYNSDPPRYEFLWGPRAYAETSKMKVLEFLAKVYDTVPSAFPFHYEEALRDEEERARARAAARPGTSARASARPWATASRSRSSHP